MNSPARMEAEAVERQNLEGDSMHLLGTKEMTRTADWSQQQILSQF